MLAATSQVIGQPMFFLALTAARTERFGRVARCKQKTQTLKRNDTYLSNSSEGVSADDWGRSAEGPRRCMGYLWILGGRRAVREERSEDGVRERREERGGGQGGGRDDAEVRARSEDGREREQRGAR